MIAAGTRSLMAGATWCGLGVWLSIPGLACAGTTYVFRAEGIQKADTSRVQDAEAVRLRLLGDGRGTVHVIDRSSGEWRVGNGDLEITVRRPLRAFAYPEVEKFQVAVGRHTGKGVAFGASILAFVPLGIMLATDVAAESGSSDVGFWPWFGTPVSLVLGGAVIGGVLGGLLGHHSRAWEKVYESPSE